MLFERVTSILSAGLMVFGTGVVCSQDYPNKPVRFVTSLPGGATDFVGRIIAQGISGPLGQPVIIENRGGVNVAELTVVNAPPDGYTLLIWSTALWVVPFLQKTPYEAVRDFSPITVIGGSPNILVLHSSVPAKSVKELITLAKATSGGLNYASGVPGSSSHLAAELFKAMAGVNLVRVPYKGTGPAILGLVSGEVQLMFGPAASVAPLLNSGKLTAVAVTSAHPSALFPGLPTIAASGLPGYATVSNLALFAPAKTNATIIKLLNQEIVRVLNRTDTKERFAGVGIEAVGSSPDELAALIKSEMASLGKLIKDAGIKGE